MLINTRQDAMFVNATAQDWQKITAPKVQGAWNMHELLPKDLDFFLSLSSASGCIGNVGQSIYAGTSVCQSKPSMLTSKDHSDNSCERRLFWTNLLGTATNWAFLRFRSACRL
jgi:hypothetical protein